MIWPRQSKVTVRAAVASLTILGLLAACSPDDQPVVSRSAASAPVLDCATSVAIGPLVVRASIETDCLTRSGLTWSSTSTVSVGGIELAPRGESAKLVFDPLNARISANSYTASGSLLGKKVLIADGNIDWSFQYRPGQNGALGPFMPAVSDVVNLDRVAQLPGLADVRTFSTDAATGFVDYSGVSDESASQLAGLFPSLSTSSVSIPLDAIGLTAVPRLTVSLPTVAIQQIAGLEVGGAVTLQPVTRDDAIGLSIGGSLQLPGVFSGANGSFGFFVPVNGDTILDELVIDVPVIEVGAGRVEDLLLNYDAPTKTWSGKVFVQLGPAAKSIGIGGSMSIVDGKLNSIGVQVAGLPVDIGGVISLNRLGGEVTFEPFRLSATGQIGLGPFVPNIGNVAIVDGSLSIDESEVAISGLVTIGSVDVLGTKIRGLEVADARVAYRWDGRASIAGNAYFFLDAARTWGVRGQLRGAATATDVSIGGDVSIYLGPLFELGGSAAASTKGWIACGRLAGTWFSSESRLGLAYDWGAESIAVRGNDCNTAEYEVDTTSPAPQTPIDSNPETSILPVSFVRAAGVPVDAGTESFELRSDEQMLTITLEDVDGTARVVSPDGTVINVSDEAEVETDDPTDPRWIVLRPPGSTEAFVVVGSPQGGRWTVETPSNPETQISASVVSASSRPEQAPLADLVPTAPPVSEPPGESVTPTTDQAAMSTAPETTSGGDDAPAATIPAASIEPVTTTDSDTAGSVVSSGPTAGDTGGQMWWILLGAAVLAGAVVAGLLLRRRADRQRPSR
jgi:hypothetical protein